MNVSLTPELEEFVKSKVESGLYNSASEVIRDALRSAVRSDAAKKGISVSDLLRRANEQVDRGESIPYTPELRKRLSVEARILAESGEEIDPDVAL